MKDINIKTLLGDLLRFFNLYLLELNLRAFLIVI